MTVTLTRPPVHRRDDDADGLEGLDVRIAYVRQGAAVEIALYGEPVAVLTTADAVALGDGLRAAARTAIRRSAGCGDCGERPDLVGRLVHVPGCSRGTVALTGTLTPTTLPSRVRTVPPTRRVGDRRHVGR